MKKIGLSIFVLLAVFALFLSCEDVAKSPATVYEYQKEKYKCSYEVQTYRTEDVQYDGKWEIQTPTKTILFIANTLLGDNSVSVLTFYTDAYVNQATDCSVTVTKVNIAPSFGGNDLEFTNFIITKYELIQGHYWQVGSKDFGQSGTVKIDDGNDTEGAEVSLTFTL